MNKPNSFDNHKHAFIRTVCQHCGLIDATATSTTYSNHGTGGRHGTGSPDEKAAVDRFIEKIKAKKREQPNAK